MSVITDNVERVRERIAAAAERAGRNPEEVTLVAVSKKIEIPKIKEAIEAGITNLGENYIQEAYDKFQTIGRPVRWNFIGHLQRNKVKPALEIFDLIQSIDSRSLAEEVNKRAVEMGREVEVLVEVNLAGEETKFGTEPEAALDLIARLEDLTALRLRGLMGMAPIVESPEQARPYFASLRRLWDSLPEDNRVYLSMGMTSDFEVAIEEGATMVRVGTAIFGPRTY